MPVRTLDTINLYDKYFCGAGIIVNPFKKTDFFGNDALVGYIAEDNVTVQTIIKIPKDKTIDNRLFTFGTLINYYYATVLIKSKRKYFLCNI